MAAAKIQKCRIKAGDAVSQFLGLLDECLRHLEAVSIFSWASRNHYNFFAHISLSSLQIDISLCSVYIIHKTK